MSYKDMSQNELAEMSDSEIETMIRKEIMEQGIREFEDPGEFDLPKPHIKIHKLYEVAGVKFTTSGLAEKFLALNPLTTDYHWRIGSELRYAKPVDREIKIVELYDKEDLAERGDDLIPWSTKHRQWNERKARYEAYLSRRNGIHSEVWDAVTKAREALQERQEIQKAYVEYKILANGDDAVAWRFMVKTYGAEKVSAACEGLPFIETSTEEEVTA